MSIHKSVSPSMTHIFNILNRAIHQAVYLLGLMYKNVLRGGTERTEHIQIIITSMQKVIYCDTKSSTVIGLNTRPYGDRSN